MTEKDVPDDRSTKPQPIRQEVQGQPTGNGGLGAGGATQAAEQTKTTPVEVINNWWSIVLIAVAIIGGFLWLESNYAKIAKLNTEKCVLSYEIMLSRSEVQFKDIDEKIALNRSELDDLLSVSSAQQAKIDYFKEYIAQLEGRLREEYGRRECLRKAQHTCIEGKHELNECKP